MIRYFVITQTVIVIVAYLLLFLTAQVKVAIIDTPHDIYTAEFHWFRSILFDDNGKTICQEISFGGSAKKLLDRVNLHHCGDAKPFVIFTGDVEAMVDELSLNVFEILVTTLAGIGVAWTMLTVRNWRTSMFNVMVLLHLLASVFAAILFAHTRYAMDGLRKTGNNNEGQRVYLGEGFMVAVILPIILLLHDQFVSDYLAH